MASEKVSAKEESKADEASVANKSESGDSEPTPQDLSDYEFLASQIYIKLLHYPLPKVSKELQREAFANEESLFKLKLLDFNEKVMEMSAIDFDQISLDRIPK